MNGWPARQRGAIGILAATTLLLALICLLLVVDTGRLYLEQRNLQRVADVAALESASQGALCGDQSSAQATSFAKASAMLNGFDADAAGSSLSAEVGGVLSAGGLRSFIASASNAAAANEAVHVEVTKSVPGSLVANLGGLFGGGNANVDLRAEAVARRLPNATISAGTGLASVNSGQSALLNPILSGLLGTHIDLSAAAYNGIADAKLSVLDILGADGMGLIGVDTSLGTIEQLLNTNVGLQQVLAASVNVLAKNGVASVEALRAQLVGVKSATLKLGDLLGLSAGEVNSMSQLDTAINALDLIMAVAQVANKNSAVAVNLGIPGLANARLTVVEPKRIVSGPPGQDESGAWRTEVRQSQVRLTADIDSGFLSILATTKLQLAIEGASGAVWLKSMACTRPDTALDFGWRSRSDDKDRQSGQHRSGRLDSGAWRLGAIGSQARYLDRRQLGRYAIQRESRRFRSRPEPQVAGKRLSRQYPENQHQRQSRGARTVLAFAVRLDGAHRPHREFRGGTSGRWAADADPESGPALAGGTTWIHRRGDSEGRCRQGGTADLAGPPGHRACQCTTAPLPCCIAAGDRASANWVRLCICIRRSTWETYSFTVFSVMPSS